MTEQIDYLGFRLLRTTIPAYIELISGAVRSGRRLTVSFLGFDSVNVVPRDLINKLDVVTPEGISVITGGRLLGMPLGMENRISGDIMLPFLYERAVAFGWRFFWLGAKPGVAERAREIALERWPKLDVAGCHHGYLADLTTARAASHAIEQAQPDIVLVGMGQPLQERWIAAQDAPRVYIAVGGYLDHQARRQDIYPDWANRLRLNSLYRIRTEPRRLWRRYTLGSMKFADQVFKEFRGRPRASIRPL